MPIRTEDRVGFVTELFDYAGGSNIVYHGIAHPGTLVSEAHWQIKKFTYDANNNITNIQWAEGVSTNDKKWSDRTTYTYS